MFKKLLLPIITLFPVVGVISCGSNTTEVIPFESQISQLDELFDVDEILINNSLDDSIEYIDENEDDPLSILRYLSFFPDVDSYEELELFLETTSFESEIFVGGKTIDDASGSYYIEFGIRLREEDEEREDEDAWEKTLNYFTNVITSDTNVELKDFMDEVNGVNRQSNFTSDEISEFVSTNPFAYAQHPTSKLNDVLDHTDPIVNLLEEDAYYISGARVNTSSYVNDIYLINFNLYSKGETVAENEFITSIQYALISKDI